MATKIAPQEMVSAKVIGRWEQVAQKLVALAEAFPESKFDFKPMEDVKSIAEVLRHVAFWNQYVADTARGNTADDTANELPKAKYPTKASIVNALQHSFSDATGALKEISPGLRPELLETLLTFIEHNCEHYGQLVVYARLNKIVPPASRG